MQDLLPATLLGIDGDSVEAVIYPTRRRGSPRNALSPRISTPSCIGREKGVETCAFGRHFPLTRSGAPKEVF